MKKHYLIGIAGAGSLIIIYLSIITVVQDWTHALRQTTELWYWVLALATGFGIQAGLFSFVRQSIRERRAATTSSVAVSGGTSVGSMVACCAHHLSDILPLLGLSGLAIFLVRYQLFFIVLGVVSNIVGITIMLETIQRCGLSRRLAHWQGNLNWIKKGTIVAAALIVTVTFFLST